jgi:hypothetical protein
VGQRQRRLDPVVLKLGKEQRQLIGAEHPLVDDGARRQAGDVEVRLLGHVEAPHLVARAAPDDVQLPFERVVVAGQRRVAADEQLLDHRLRPLRAGTDHAVVGRDLAPAEERLPLVVHHLLEQVLARRAAARIVGQEDDAHAVLPGRGELDAAVAANRGEEAMRHLHQDAGAVTGVLLAAGGAAVLQVRQHFESVRDD